MNYIKKSFNFLYGLFLFFLHSKKIDINALLKGKRVAIIGAANSAYNTGKGEWIDKFDVVIRINKAPYVLISEQWKQDIGTKTDMLFHSFFENEISGGGSIDLHLYDKLGIKYIINPVTAYAGYRVTFNFYKKYLVNRKTYRLPVNSYTKIQKPLAPFRPTIGYCALMSVLETEFSELYITGFTFFKTAFGEGYRNEIKEATEAQKYIKEAGLHHPDLEYSHFIETLQINSSKNIDMDDILKSISQTNR
jgi:hypothetical protein